MDTLSVKKPPKTYAETPPKIYHLTHRVLWDTPVEPSSWSLLKVDLGIFQFFEYRIMSKPIGSIENGIYIYLYMNGWFLW